MADTFNFPHHTVETRYPESSFRLQFGKSYVFAGKPSAPDQRIFSLKFPTMVYYLDGSTIDLTPNPTFNMAVLEAFYTTHRLYEKFTYPHAVLGNLIVRFHKPLIIPEGIKGGSGAVKPFDVEFMEQP